MRALYEKLKKILKNSIEKILEINKCQFVLYEKQHESSAVCAEAATKNY